MNISIPILWIICILVTVFIADRKKRSVISWCFLSAILGPLALIAVSVSSKIEQKEIKTIDIFQGEIMNRHSRKSPIFAMLLAVIFIVMSVIDFFHVRNTIEIVITKDSIVELMENNLANWKTSHEIKPEYIKPLAIQEKLIQALKDYKPKPIFFILELMAIISDIGLFLIGIFIFTLKKWTNTYALWFLPFYYAATAIDKLFFLAIDPLPNPIIILSSQFNRICFASLEILALSPIFALIMWYFNNKNVKEFFQQTQGE
jgi:hypothetical protein